MEKAGEKLSGAASIIRAAISTAQKKCPQGSPGSALTSARNRLSASENRSAAVFSRPSKKSASLAVSGSTLEKTAGRKTDRAKRKIVTRDCITAGIYIRPETPPSFFCIKERRVCQKEGRRGLNLFIGKFVKPKETKGGRDDQKAYLPGPRFSSNDDGLRLLKKQCQHRG